MDERRDDRVAAAAEPSNADAINHRRNYLAGLWAAELLGLIGQAAQDYARSVTHPNHSPETRHGDDSETVIRKLTHDLGPRVGVGHIREKMALLLAEARRQIQRRN